MSMRVSVIGDGGMATICSVILAENGHRVRLYSIFPEAAAALARDRENKRFMPGLRIPDSVQITSDAGEALTGAEIAIQTVPTQFVRPWWRTVAGTCAADLPVCSVAKGIENGTLLRPTQVVRDVLDGAPDSARPVAVLSGPCIAREVARHQPATVTAAAADERLAIRVQEMFTRPYFRVYTHSDVIGTEIAAATKNVIAIAAGILDGLGTGDNAKAALVTRGLVEITRLGVAMGALAETFAGLAGVGDLVTTCISPVGRNRGFGERIGRGASVAEALGATECVVEGAATTRSVIELAERYGVDMPITRAVADVLFGGVSPSDAIASLMTRPMKAEM